MHKHWSTGGDLPADLVNDHGEAGVGVGPWRVVEMERHVVRLIGDPPLVIAQGKDEPVRVVACELR